MSSLISSIQNSVHNLATSSYNFVEGKVSHLGKSFEDLTEKALPHTAARIVQLVVYSAPFAAAWLVLPLQLNIAALVVYGIAHVLNESVNEQNARLLPDNVYRNFFFGTGAVLFAATALETAKVATGQKASIVLAIAEFALGAFAIRHSTVYASKEQPAAVVGTPG